MKAGVVQPVVLGLEGLDRAVLTSERLDDGMARVHLLDVAVEGARRRPLGHELLLGPAGDEDRHDDRQGDREERDRGKDRADRQHQDEHADDREERGDELGQALLEGLADVVDVIRHATQDVASRVAVEVLERQPTQFAIDVSAEPIDRPLGDAGHDVGLHPGEDRAQHVDADEQQEDLAERREVDPHAGRQMHAREHVRELVLAAGPEAGDDLLLAGAGGQVLADDSLEDVVGGGAQDLGTDDREGDADDGQRDHQGDEPPLRL